MTLDIFVPICLSTSYENRVFTNDTVVNTEVFKTFMENSYFEKDTGGF